MFTKLIARDVICNYICAVCSEISLFQSLIHFPGLANELYWYNKGSFGSNVYLPFKSSRTPNELLVQNEQSFEVTIYVHGESMVLCVVWLIQVYTINIYLIQKSNFVISLPIWPSFIYHVFLYILCLWNYLFLLFSRWSILFRWKIQGWLVLRKLLIAVI